MKIQFISPKRSGRNQVPGIALLKNGKLSLNKSFCEKYDISINTYFRIGIDVENPNDKSLYIQKCSKNELESRKVQKSGEQHYLPASFVLDRIGIDYSKNKYDVDFKETMIEGNTFFKVTFSSIV